MSNCFSVKNGDDGNTDSEGWIHRFTISTDRVEEIKILFEEMGEEVRISQINVENFSNTENCDTCLVECGDELRTVWTRKLDQESKSQKDNSTFTIPAKTGNTAEDVRDRKGEGEGIA